jgi:hypothetical protein
MKPIVFIATPIASFTDKKEYNSFRIKIKALAKKLQKNVNVISKILNISNASNYDPPSLSAKNDFRDIDNSSFFVLIYPQQMPTSALVELGYALALKKKILILTVSQDVLPYMLKELDEAYSNVQISYFPIDWTGVEDTIFHFVLN